MVDGIGSIGSSGATAFDLGGVAPGGGVSSGGLGDLGAAGLGPIGSSGLAAFDLSGPVGDSAGAARFDQLMQQNSDMLKRIRDEPPPLSVPNPPAFQAFDPMRFEVPSPPSFTTQPLDPFAANVPGLQNLTLPPAAGGPAAFPAPVGLAPAALGPDALASPVVSPQIPVPTTTADPFTPIAAGGLGLSPIGPIAQPALDAGPAVDPAAVPPATLPTQPPAYLAGLPATVASTTGEPTPVLTPLGQAILTETWPARLVQGLWSGATAPGDALFGRFDPMADAQQYGILGRTGQLAGLAMTGGLGGVSAGGTTLGSAPVRQVPGAAAVGEAPSAARQTLYHYTNEAGVAGITGSNALNPSMWRVGTKDVRYGNGQYVSDIAPGTKTPSQLSREFLGRPFHGDRFTHFVEIDAAGLGAVQGRPGVFVIPNETPLDLTGRLLSSGKVPGP